MFSYLFYIFQIFYVNTIFIIEEVDMLILKITRMRKIILGAVIDFVPLWAQISKNLDIQNKYFLYIFKNISPGYSYPSF